jgi:hypothetical protein
MATLMTLDRQNFEAWFAAVLESLYPTRDAGLIVAMVTFPLLERYLRQKVVLPADQRLTDAFHDELARLIPGLRDRAQAKQFWSAVRNGLLHQATVQPDPDTKSTICALTHDIPCIFLMDETTGTLVLHPVLFAKRVIEVIRADFATFVGQAHTAPPLSRARPMIIHGGSTQHTATVSTTPLHIILGTSTSP